MVSPASTVPLRFTSTGAAATLSSDICRSELVGVLVEDAFEVTVAPPGVRADAVAVLSTVRASASTWVIVYGVVVEQVVDAFGARVVATQVVAPTLASAIASPVRVVAPVFVRAKR